jgi:hypothetical protein
MIESRLHHLAYQIIDPRTVVVLGHIVQPSHCTMSMATGSRCILTVRYERSDVGMVFVRINPRYDPAMVRDRLRERFADVDVWTAK